MALYILWVQTNVQWVSDMTINSIIQVVLLHPSQHLVSSMLQILTIPIDVQWFIIVILICISLMTYDREHVFIYLFIFGCAGSSLLHGLFSSCREWGPLFVAMRGLLIVVASPVAKQRL